MLNLIKRSVLPILFSILPLAAHADDAPRPEALFAWGMDQRGVIFRVFSGGCTNRGSFRLVRAPAARGEAVRMTLYRVVEDHCLALFPYGVSIRYDYNELGLTRGQPFQITNRFRTGPY